MMDILAKVDRLVEIEAQRKALHDETVEIIRETSRHLTPVCKGLICCLSFYPDSPAMRKRAEEARDFIYGEYQNEPITALPGMTPTPPVALPGM